MRRVADSVLPCLESAILIETKPVADKEFISKFRTPKIAAAIKAGQFVMVSFPETVDPLLPRAYSVSDVDGDCINLFYMAVGKGSNRLSNLRQGEGVRLNGPLGNGFPTPARGEEIWMVVGGSGAALLPILIKASKNTGASVKIFYGAKTKTHICSQLVEPFASYDVDSISRTGSAGSRPMQDVFVKAYYATDDGTFGYHGTIVQLLKSKMSPHPNPLPMGKVTKPSKIFACGPTPMLVALQREVGTVLPTYISVETPMACGMGFCQGCPVKISRGSNDPRAGTDYFLACKDGPVFESRQIEIE